MTASLLIGDVNDFHPVTEWTAYAAFSPVLIAKATQGTSFVATTFASARAGAANAGLKAFGMYHFWQPGQDPVAQAQHAVATIGKLSDAPVEWLILDVETGDDMAAYHQCQDPRFGGYRGARHRPLTHDPCGDRPSRYRPSPPVPARSLANP